MTETLPVVLLNIEMCGFSRKMRELFELASLETSGYGQRRFGQDSFLFFPSPAPGKNLLRRSHRHSAGCRRTRSSHRLLRPATGLVQQWRRSSRNCTSLNSSDGWERVWKAAYQRVFWLPVWVRRGTVPEVSRRIALIMHFLNLSICCGQASDLVFCSLCSLLEWHMIHPSAALLMGRTYLGKKLSKTDGKARSGKAEVSELLAALIRYASVRWKVCVYDNKFNDPWNGLRLICT